ncbi:MAG TPA: glycosyl hydrolase family 79 C-terminal domain-containing protein [Acidobacteriaceae bacterium]
MNDMNRRHFLSATAIAAATTFAHPAWALEGAASPSLTIHTDKALAHIPADFTGLSYESSQLVHSNFFSGDNTTLVQFFRTLGADGVLRLGGNMSEFTSWSPVDLSTGEMDADGTEGPDPGKGTTRTFVITPLAIRNLNAFLEATNWKLIYGLNLARGSADSAADEAAYVAKICGPRLLAFQFGNEPDLFKHNGDPKDRWKYAEYIAKWQAFRKSVLERVPKAPLAGPDTSFKPDWVGNFANDTKGTVSLLTAHYYAEGPPTNPRMTIDYLLNQQEKFMPHVTRAVELARQAGLPYRMSEGNTCYNAGKKGVSDTFASALWAGDFLSQIAAIGGTGVNMHGGGNGLYTPIAGSPKEGFSARPEYYGLLFVRPLFGATMLASDLQNEGMNMTAYAMQKKGKITILAFNKGNKTTALTVSLPSSRTKGSASILRLASPALDATSGLMLGGAAVSSNGTWKPDSNEMLHPSDGIFQVSLPAFSAAAVSFA